MEAFKRFFGVFLENETWLEAPTAQDNPNGAGGSRRLLLPKAVRLEAALAPVHPPAS